MLSLVFALVQALVVVVKAWSSLTMCWRTTEQVASASIGANVVAWIATKAMTLGLCMMGCSCRLDMKLTNLVLGVQVVGRRDVCCGCCEV